MTTDIIASPSKSNLLTIHVNPDELRFQITEIPEIPAIAPGQGIVPRDYQTGCFYKVFEAIMRGILSLLIQAPTGSGKTLIFLLVALAIHERGGRVLILVHRDELLTQAINKVRELAPHIDVGIVKGPVNEIDRPLVVASVQSLSRPGRLKQLARDFGIVIVDEAHHSTAPSYRAIFDRTNAGKPGGALLLGVSATIDRTDGVGLGNIYQELVFNIPMMDLMKVGHLVDVEARQVAIEADFDRLHTRGGDIIESESGAMLLAADAPNIIVQAYQQFADPRLGITFTPTVAVAHAVADAFNAAGIVSAAIDGTTPLDERRQILAAFARGEIRMLANCLVLTEGFDAPAVSCIINARPTKSRSLFVQMLGRGMRPHPLKQNLLFIEVTGKHIRHDLQSVPSLFGLPIKQLKNQTVLGAMQEDEWEDEWSESPIPGGQIVTAKIDLFQQRPAHWIPVQGGKYLLPAGESALVLRPGFGEKWDVLETRRNFAPRVIGHDLSLSFAQGTAEDYAKQLGATALIDRHAPWRSESPTEKQLLLLHKNGISVQSIRTKGEASDAIGALFAAKAVA